MRKELEGSRHFEKSLTSVVKRLERSTLHPPATRLATIRKNASEGRRRRIDRAWMARD